MLFAAFLALGWAVSRRPLRSLDARAVYFRSQGTALALLLTKTGRSKALIAGYVAAIAIYAAGHLPLWIPLVLAASQFVSQIIVESFKLLFRRVRPDYWLIGLDAGHSYPSGHAATAVVSFLGWAVVAASSGLPGELKWPVAIALALWAVGVDWSRLALGAHYLSDVAGGTLFGGAWLCALIAVLGNISLVT